MLEISDAWGRHPYLANRRYYVFVFYMEPVRPTRKWLRHETPNWIRTENERFFITICCQQRGVVQLTKEVEATGIIDSFKFGHTRGDWYGHLFLLMPDHLHAIMSFPEPFSSMKKSMQDWKRLMARRHGIQWQDGFFEHRLRGSNAWDEKAAYIRKNPVRAGLCSTPEEWSWMWEPFSTG
ncbi:REP-associated tyrosine transposase [Coraliomargarita sp. W4R53]